MINNLILLSYVIEEVLRGSSFDVDYHDLTNAIIGLSCELLHNYILYM